MPLTLIQAIIECMYIVHSFWNQIFQTWAVGEIQKDHWRARKKKNLIVNVIV